MDVTSSAHNGPLALAGAVGALTCLLLFAQVSAAAGVGALESVDLELEGRLLRVRLKATAPMLGYTLSRQGPPEKRDLVVRLPGFSSDIPGAIDTGDYLLPIEVQADEGGAGITVLMEDVGDSLVSITQDGAELSVLLIPPEKRSEAGEGYLIGPDDMLQVDVFGHEDLNKTLKVSPRGLINLPLIGNVRAQGRTVDALAEEITQRLAEKYLQDPHVTVSVWEYLSQWVNVIGEVARPGRYYLTGPTTLVDALSQAGGLAPAAGEEILVARRPDEVDPASAGEVFHVSIRSLFSSEGSHLNMRLRSGDVVNVLSTTKVSEKP